MEDKTTVEILGMFLILVIISFLFLFSTRPIDCQAMESLEEQKEVPFEGIMVMDDTGDLYPYYYIAKWNVYGKLPDDYKVTAFSPSSILYENDTDWIWVRTQYLNYRWDNPKSNGTDGDSSLNFCSYISSLLEAVRTEYSNGSGTTGFGISYTINSTINYMGLKCPNCGFIWELLPEDEINEQRDKI